MRRPAGPTAQGNPALRWDDRYRCYPLFATPRRVYSEGIRRTVQGAGAETFHYDAIGRLTTHASDLGSFTLSYLGQTGQMTGRQLASSTLATSWSYLNNTGDRRLSGINNVVLTAGQFSTFAYTTTRENFIAGITETSDSAASAAATTSRRRSAACSMTARRSFASSRTMQVGNLTKVVDPLGRATNFAYANPCRGIATNQV